MRFLFCFVLQKIDLVHRFNEINFSLYNQPVRRTMKSQGLLSFVCIIEIKGAIYSNLGILK